LVVDELGEVVEDRDQRKSKNAMVPIQGLAKARALLAPRIVVYGPGAEPAKRI
jgi:hypothetical protein